MRNFRLDDESGHQEALFNWAAYRTGLMPELQYISVTLCWDNLEALCQDCHNKEHHKQERHKRYRFDENGGILPPYQKNN